MSTGRSPISIGNTVTFVKVFLLFQYVLLSATIVTAFVVPPYKQQNILVPKGSFPSSTIIRLYQSTQEEGAPESQSQSQPTKQKAKRKKKVQRRFGQEAHAVADQDRQAKRKKNKQQRQQLQQQEQPYEESAEPIFSREPSMRTPQPNNSNKNNHKNNNDDDSPWRSGKSIDELESVMLNRFGDKQSDWMADADDYEEQEDEKKSNKSRRQVSSPPTQTRKQTSKISPLSPVFRAKPVDDPWESSQDKKRKKKAFQERNGIDEGDDLMLSRVRRNQERLQDKRETNNDDNRNTNDSISNGNNREKERVDPTQQYGIKESNENNVYYNDEIYNEDDDDEFIIEPEPVRGGKGSSAVSAGTAETGGGGGFFFRETVPNDATTQQETGTTTSPVVKAVQTTAQEQPQKKKRKSLPAVLDSDGNPLFLTVEQAVRNFESTLVRPNAEKEGEVDEDDAKQDGSYTSPLSTSTWEELGITDSQLIDNLERAKCGSPLSVQEKSCQPILSGDDVLVGTYTGSGKTLAFLTPLIQRWILTAESSPSNDIQILIVAPGRELASQIVSVARSLLEGTDRKAMLAIGGTTFSRNLEQIRKKKPIILVGTPGRVAELVVGRPGDKSGRLKITSMKSLVMDEFDALLEYKPHRDPTNAILQTLKRRHGDNLQSILCSATASDMVKSPKLSRFLRPDFVKVNADDDDQLVTSAGEDTPLSDTPITTRVSKTVIHGALHLQHRRVAIDTLRKILYTEPLPQQALIFADSSRRVEIIVEKLAGMGIIAAPLHGGKNSEKVDRTEVSKALREGYVGLVVATEMAARGLDAPLLTHVINLDLPTDASHYAHRAGRCGRGGRPGVVINITTDPKERNVPKRFAESLGVTMHTVEPKGGKLCIVDPNASPDDL